MQWIVIFIIGLIVGVVAKLIMPGKDPGGFIVTGLLGIAGSFVGGGIASVLFGKGLGGTASGAGVGGFMGFVFAVIGAIILLYAWRLLTRNKRRP